MGLRTTKRIVGGGIGLLLAFAIIFTPLTTFAAPTVWLRGTVSNVRPGPEPIPGVQVYATAPGGSIPLYGPVPTTPWGEYQLYVDPGTYDIHFVPATDGWESGFNAVTEPDVVLQTSRTLDKTLSYKPVSTPVGFGELRCGASADNPNAHIFTLFNYGSYGFTPDAMVGISLNPGNVSLGSTRSSESGYTYGGYSQGFVGSGTQMSPFTLASGQYSLTFSAPGSPNSAPVPFTVPHSCPDFSLEITPGVSGNAVAVNQSFPVAILSTSEFDAPARVDVSSVRFGAGSEQRVHGVAPQSCNLSTDVNNDGRNDVVCTVGLPSLWNAGQYNVLLTGRTIDEGSSLDGFLFVRHATVDVAVLAAPANLAATSPTNAAPALSWTASSGAQGYNVYRNGALVGSTTQTTFNDSTLAADGTYSYTVRTKQGTLLSDPSSSVQVIRDTAAPSASNLNLSGMTTWSIFNIPLFSYFPAATTQTTITASTTDGTSGSGVVAAEYYFDNNAHVAMTVANGTATAPNVSIAGLAAGNHTINVRVKDAAGNWSPVVSQTFVKF